MTVHSNIRKCWSAGALLAAALAGAAPPLRAGDILVFSGTGAEFVADAQTSFPTQQPTLDGDRMVLAAPADNQVLAAHALSVPGVYGCASRPIVVTMSLTLTRLSDDFDPVFLVRAGDDAIGGQVGDNPNGSARVITGTIANNILEVASDPFVFQGAGFPAIGGSLDALIQVTITSGGTSVRIAFGSADQTTQVASTLDGAADLSFLLVANSAVGSGEIYGVDALELSITAPSACAEDVDGDDDVDFADLNTLLGEFNTSGADLMADIDCDGDVDFADLNRLLSVFNTAC